MTGSDAVIYTLDIGPISICNDTARVKVIVDAARRCPGSKRPVGFGNVDNVYIARAAPGLWGAAQSSGTLHGDRVGCLHNRP